MSSGRNRKAAAGEQGGTAVLDAPVAIAHARSPRILALPLESIVESADNPRKHFDAALVDRMSASMAASGQWTACIVRPHPTQLGRWELAAGATRLRAARKAALATLNCDIRDMTDAEFLELVSFENLERRDLQPMEEARGYANLQKKLEGWTVDKIAERSGVSVDYVRDRLRLLKLVPEAVALLEAGTIVLGHALELAKIPADKQREAVENTGRRVGPLWAVKQLASTDNLELLGDDPHHGLVVKSVAELRAWIDKSVRVDLSHPELEHLLPDTARRLAAAQAEQRKQVYISFGYVGPDVKGKEKVIGPQSWKKAESKDGSAACEHAVLGIVFAGDAARGHAFLVCTNKDRCKTHWAQHVKKREQREKARRGELTTKSGAKVSEAAVVQKQREQQAKEEAARELRRKALAAAAPAVIDALVTAVARTKPLVLAKMQKLEFQNSSIAKRVKALPSKTAEEVLRQWFLEAHLGRIWNAGDEHAFDRTLKPLGKALGVDVESIIKKHAPTPPPPPMSETKETPKVTKAVRAEVARVVAKVKATGKPVKRKPNQSFMAPVTPNAKLAAVVGAKPLVRTELTKKLWEYIKKQGLQDKKNRRMINADEKLKAVFGGKAQVSILDMTKLISKNLVAST